MKETNDKTRNTVLLASPNLEEETKTDDIFDETDYRLIWVDSIDEIGNLLSQERIDIVIIEEDLPDLNLLDLMIMVRSSDPDIPIIVLSKSGVKKIDQKIWSYGIDDCIRKPFSYTELLHRVSRSLKIRRLSGLYSSLQIENRNLRQLSQTDALTQLTNRRFFNEIIASEFARVTRYGGNLGCLMIDIDHFKNVNDTYGHLTGDRVLKALAEILSKNVRTTDIVARYGGEEFIILLPETGIPGIMITAEKLRETTGNYNFRNNNQNVDDAPKNITISVGVSQFLNKIVKTPEELINFADKALYNAKDSGRNKVVLWSQNI